MAKKMRYDLSNGDYYLMFDADERQRNEWVMLEAQESAWYIHDVQLGKHFDDDFDYLIYEK